MRPVRRRAVFFDRDGTLCAEGPPPHRFEDLRIFADAVPVVQWLRARGFVVAVVSNQAAVARGVLTAEEVRRTHLALSHYFANCDAPLLATRFCPHHPEGVVPEYARQCPCRKPAPGMLTAMASTFGIDLARSWMVGDNLTDILAGRQAGCRSALVRTGHGRQWESRLPPGVPVIDRLQDLPRLVGEVSEE